MTSLHDPTVLPAGLPPPQDDGAARHLPGTRLPDLSLPTTDGTSVNFMIVVFSSVGVGDAFLKTSRTEKRMRDAVAA